MAVDGKYEITLDAPIGRQRAALEFVTEGSKLSGAMNGAMGVLEFAGGAVDGSSVRWTMDGVVTAMYSKTAHWDCRATIDGDKITGEAKIGDLGDAPFHGVRVGAEGARPADADKPTIAWTDLGLPRYEAISLEWVNAARDYVREKTKDKVVDFEVAWSVEYVDPPAHLLRGHGDNVVGYHYLAKDGKFDVVDGPLESADVRAIYPYDPFAVGLRMNTDQWVAWVTENGAKYRDQVKSTGDMSKARLISDLMAGQGNDIREEFLSQRTA